MVILTMILISLMVGCSSIDSVESNKTQSSIEFKSYMDKSKKGCDIKLLNKLLYDFRNIYNEKQKVKNSVLIKIESDYNGNIPVLYLSKLILAEVYLNTEKYEDAFNNAYFYFKADNSIMRDVYFSPKNLDYSFGIMHHCAKKIDKKKYYDIVDKELEKFRARKNIGGVR